ncbi:hypothetical protein DDI_0673 [Dickeya dianthicola RNS04.9]|nr:hypothetical protein DDI_0673 [Dickeya dianthicola RNS04.9]
MATLPGDMGKLKCDSGFFVMVVTKVLRLKSTKRTIFYQKVHK